MNTEVMKANDVEAKGNLATITSPMSLIESAVSSNANVETLTKLMDLQERYEAGEARKSFFRAMQKFQGIKPELVRASKVSFGNTNYKFCSLSDIEKELKAPLSDTGLSYRFENGQADDKFSVTCIVSHVDGHSERTTMTAPADDSGNKNKIQSIGSTSSYLMRYTLISAFALTTADEDNDGASNSDLPFQRVIEQNDHLRIVQTLKAVLAIKESLAEEDYYTVCSYFFEMPEETRNALWVAPSKGGIFSTEERKALQSNEFAGARADYYAEKEQ